MAALTLVSHTLCPYVQRAAVVLLEKGVPFERRWVDLAHKPEWFLAVSPLGKTPVLLVDDKPIFESAVICEYLDETLPPRLHPEDAIERARHRGWMEFGSALLNTIAGFYNAPDEAVLKAKAGELHDRFGQVEATLGVGPYFAGVAFGIVDAVFGPVFRYIDAFDAFDAFDAIHAFGILGDYPKVRCWRAALAARESVRQAAHPRYAELLNEFLLARGSALSRIISK